MYHCRISPKKGLLTIHLSGWCHWNAPWFLTDTEGGHSSSQGTAFHLPSLPRTHQTWQIAALSYKCLHFLLPGLQLCNTEDEIITYSMSCREVLAVTAANERSPHLPSLLRKASHGRVPSNRAWATAFSQNKQPGVQAAKNNLWSKLPKTACGPSCQEPLPACSTLQEQWEHTQQMLWEWWEAGLMLSVKCGKNSPLAEEIESFCSNLNPSN